MEVERDPAVINWVSRLAKVTGENYKIAFNAWLRWLKVHGGEFSDMSPGQLIEYQKNSDNGSRFNILDVVQTYVLSQQETKRYNSLRQAYSTIRSFFAHNRASLPRDSSFRIKSDIPKVNGLLSVENIRDMVLALKPVFRAVYLSIFQGALDLEMFNFWNLNGLRGLEEQLKENSDTVRIDLPGRKQNRNVKPYYTFIGRDAIDAIIDYWEIRPKRNDAIFFNQSGKPMTPSGIRAQWSRTLIRLGLITPDPSKGRAARYGMNLHELRDLFRTQWSRSPAKWNVGEFFMGHSVDPLEYDKSSRHTREYQTEYRKAAPLLNILSDPSALGLIETTELEGLRSRVHELEAMRLSAQAVRGEEVGLLRLQVSELQGQMDEYRKMLKLIYDNPDLAEKLKEP